MIAICFHHTTTQQQSFYGHRQDYPDEPVPEETFTHHHPDHHPIFITFFHLLRSIASFLFKLHAWQSFCTTSLRVLFGLCLGLEPSTSYGNWTTRRYANSRTGHLADWSTRGLDNSQTSQLADWTSHGLHNSRMLPTGVFVVFIA